MKLALVSMTGGKQERNKLKYRGDHGFRARIIVQDLLERHDDLDGVLVSGMSDYQMKHVDAFLYSRSYKKIISPGWRKQTDKWRFTCLTAAYVRNKAEQIVYNEDRLETIYRYAAFSLPGDLEIRVVHIPCVDPDKPYYEKQYARKEAMLKWEQTLEEKEVASNRRVIVAGDWNTERENLECHDIYDALPYEKLLDEITWGASKIDNVLVSPALKGLVKVSTDDYRWGMTSDHKVVIVDYVGE